MSYIEKSIIVPYSSEQMYSLVTDVTSYPKFVSLCSNGVIEEFHEDGYTATLEFEVNRIRKSFTTKNTVVPFSKISMALKSGPFKKLSGSWQFTALGEAGCKVEFNLDYEISSKMAAVAFKPVFDTISKTMVSTFYKEARRRYGEPTKN